MIAEDGIQFRHLGAQFVDDDTGHHHAAIGLQVRAVKGGLAIDDLGGAEFLAFFRPERFAERLA